MDYLFGALKLAQKCSTTPLEQFDAVVRCLLEFHTRFSDLAIVTSTETRSLPPMPQALHVARLSQLEQQVVDTVTRGIAAGSLAAEEPRHVARAILHICLGVAQSFHVDGTLSAPEAVRAYTQICRDTARVLR